MMGEQHLNLAADINAFVAMQSSNLAVLSGREPSDHEADARIEASNLVAALIDADGRLDEAELRAYVDVIGTQLDPPVIAAPAELRASGLFTGRRAWLAQPSPMLQLLVDADARDARTSSHWYYKFAISIAHRLAAVDLVPSPSELAAIDEFRSMMLATMDRAGVPRPGAHNPGSATPATPAATPAPDPPASAPAGTGEPDAPTLDELLDQLDGLVGLDHVKQEVRQLTSLLQVQQLRARFGLPVFETSHHLVFTGNPGTGKTTVARLLSQIYRAVGVVSKGHLVETDRSHLVAGYVGQTAIRTREALESALGGTVLIDEAYALARGGENDFGREAIDTLVKFMEDHRDDLAVIAAGYTDEMATFVDANPGLASRFTRTVEFPDYTDDELVAIFCQLGDRHRYIPTDDALAVVRHRIAAAPRGRGFGNARFVRNLFDAAVARHALRVAPLPDPLEEQLTTLTAADLA